MDMDKAINMAVKSGQVEFGVEKAMQNARLGKIKLLVYAENAPKETITELEYLAKLGVPVLRYPKNRADLGAACGRPHMISVLAVYNPGDSPILQMVSK
ncbi:MAG: 50S ribosomal protein L30e [Candidatus Hodarchaeota archaeon]